MPEDLYNQLKNKYESTLDADFKVVVKNRRIMGYAVTGFIGSILLMMFGGFLGLGIIFVVGPVVAIASFITLLVMMFKGNKGENTYHTKYYETVEKDLISTLYNDVNFSLTDEYDFRNVFYTSGFDRTYDRKNVRSEWTMLHGLQRLTIYDVLLEEESTDSDGNTTYTTVFDGLFGVMYLSHAFNDDIYVNRSGGIANRGTEKVNIDSVVFSKTYKVYATNKVKAMQLLTHDVMDKILAYTEQYKTKFEFRILNDKLYFRIFNHNTFSNQSKETISKAELENDYHNLILFKDITDLIESSARENGMFD